MSEQTTVEQTVGETVALAYYDRMEAGDVTYDPNVAALSLAVRALREDNTRLRGLLADIGDPGRLEEAQEALRHQASLGETIAALDAALVKAEATPHLDHASLNELAAELARRVYLAATQGQDWATSTP